jgi:putative membrane protein
VIVRPRPRFWELFGIWRLSIVPRILPHILLVAGFAAGVTAFAHRHPRLFVSFSVAPFTLLGIALSIFLGFRNNACYDRWWEARRQLGMLVSEVRSLARLTMSLPGGDRRRRIRTVRRVIAWVYALMAHLRGEELSIALEQYLWLPDDEATSHVHVRAAVLSTPQNTARNRPNLPHRLLRIIADDYAAMMTEGEFGEIVFQRIDERLSNMATIHAACERIRSTPAPFGYTLLLHRTAYAFCFLLPFGLVNTFGYAAPVFVAAMAYTFFGLDALGDELEEPFGAAPNALPLTALARVMEISLLEAVGEPNLPPDPQPIDAILR